MKNSNWKNKSLESLEKHIWPELSEMDKQDWLIVECNALRKKPIKEYTIENLRQMIEQDIGLKYLIPLAIETLEKNIFSEGDCYPGDVLWAVLNSDQNYWNNNKDQWKQFCDLVNSNNDALKSSAITWQIRKDIFDSYKVFSKIN